MISETHPTYLGTIAVANNAYRALLRADDKAIDAKAGFDAARTAAIDAKAGFDAARTAAGAARIIYDAAIIAKSTACDAYLADLASVTE